MDSHHVLAKAVIDTMGDITAFSALPGAPVRPSGTHRCGTRSLRSAGTRVNLGGRRTSIP